MNHLRLVHPVRPRLSKVHLWHFETPKTWREIVKLEPRLSRAEWLTGIIDCDEWGFALLTWIPGDKKRYGRYAIAKGERFKGAWVLTDKGREYLKPSLPRVLPG